MLHMSSTLEARRFRTSAVLGRAAAEDVLRASRRRPCAVVVVFLAMRGGARGRFYSLPSGRTGEALAHRAPQHGNGPRRERLVGGRLEDLHVHKEHSSRLLRARDWRPPKGNPILLSCLSGGVEGLWGLVGSGVRGVGGQGGGDRIVGWGSWAREGVWGGGVGWGRDRGEQVRQRAG